MNNLSKFTNYGKVALALIGVIACLFLFGGPNNTNEMSEIESFRDGGPMSFATMFTVFILIACVALVLIFFIMQLISNPKKTLLSIIGIVVALVLFLIFWAIGTKDTDQSLGLIDSIGSVEQGTINATTAGLWVVFIGLLAAVAVIIASAVRRILKR